MSKAHRLRFFCNGVAATAAVLLLSACSGPRLPTAPAAAAVPAASVPQEYVIGRDDQLLVHFMYNPSFDQSLVVQPDGRIALPMVGSVVAGGQTPSGLSAQLSQAYDRYLQRPDVSVIVKSAESQRAFIGGEVARASLVNLTPGMTISSALIVAGGLKDTADAKRVVLLRRDAAGAEQAYNVNVASAMNGADLSQNIVLEPHDIVVAPKSDIANVNLFVKQYIRDNIPISVGAGTTIY